MGKLEGKVIIVTGGAQGIGRAICEKIAVEGAKMVIATDLQEAKFEQSNIRSIVLSTIDNEGTVKLAEDIVNEFGKIDGIVNCAGVLRDSLIHKLTEEIWNFVIDVNLKGPFYLSRAVGPKMMEQGFGSIVTISSVAGLYGNPGQTNYAATKAGVIGMSKVWSKEFSRKGAQVRSNVVAPGYIQTSILDAVPDNILEGMKKQTCLKRLGQPEEIANAVAFLLSDEASYITGQVLEVSGGVMM